MKKSHILFGGLAMVILLGGFSGMTATAQSHGASLSNILASASDNALDKLAEPGAFYKDEAVRILLPGPLKKASGLLKMTDKAGLTGDLTKSLNDAAGLAAKEAKPIFRDAISDMSLKDSVGVASKSDGATRYLRESSSDALHTKVRPLIANALGKVGAFQQLDKLEKGSSLMTGAGVSRDSLTDSVTDQTLSGIFKYMGAEEEKLRANPLDAGKSLLKGLKH